MVARDPSIARPRRRRQGDPNPRAAKITTETAYYLLSTPLSAERFGHAARSHWTVENNLHWVLDVTMNEDMARNRLDNGLHNLAVLRHMAINLISKEPFKGS